MTSSTLEKQIKTLVVSILETIVLYILIVVPLEYLLTEYFLIIPYLSNNIKTSIFLVLLTVIFLIRYLRGFSKEYHPLFILLIFLLTGLSVFGYREYRRFYEQLQTYPKIYKISRNWGIQGVLVNIEGKNFGPTWQPGKVYVDDIEFIVKYWSPSLIVVEQPVPPRFFKGNLYVKLFGDDFESKVSNMIDFEIKNPDFLDELNFK